MKVNQKGIRGIAMRVVCLMAILVSLVLAVGCETTPKNKKDKEALDASVAASIKEMSEKDPRVAQFMESAYGYVCFPTVSYGGLIAAAGSGQGEVYVQGDLVGYARIFQASVGGNVGGRWYSELIFFKDQKAFQDFKDGDLKFQAHAAAVAVTAGGGTQADYQKGVAVFTHDKFGLSAQASIGGQEFKFEPAKPIPDA